MEEKRKAAAMAALDKAEKKLSMTKEELSKAAAVLKFATTQEALATKFRFNAENIVTHENKDGEWLVWFSMFSLGVCTYQEATVGPLLPQSRRCACNQV